MKIAKRKREKSPNADGHIRYQIIRSVQAKILTTEDNGRHWLTLEAYTTVIQARPRPYRCEKCETIITTKIIRNNTIVA